MNVRLNAVFLIAAVSVAMPANAQFGMPKAPAAPAVPAGPAGGATAADIDMFLKSATEADALVADASTALLQAVASKEQVQKYMDQIAAANKIADPKEKASQLQQAETDKLSVLSSTNYEKTNKALAASKDVEKKENTKAAIFNLGLGSLKNVELVAIGKKLTSGPPNPAIAAKIPEAVSSLDKLVSQAGGLTKVVDGASKLMSAVGLEALPTKASDEPKKVKIGK